ncbi:UDP-glycosyltransferase UGT4 isoform X3 [Stomoxys calcitrans]|uniref:UDP-glycosyltransferases domain-containing protein n=1 Tax=Stomoxys calcitrans TaxID=35570 RepID=A0A1I8Q4U5_STOCA|nr:UDP-glycosyltransferase UGT4 isoform X3 [Stomoxys calcitrans]
MGRTFNCILLVTAFIIIRPLPSDGANILVFLPSFSPSHLIIETAVAEKGHNITVISVLPLRPDWLHPSVKHIQLTLGNFDMDATVHLCQSKGFRRIFNGLAIFGDIFRSLVETLDDPEMQEFMKNPGNNFDLMILGYIYGDIFFGLAELFNCPVALVWPNIAISQILQFIGNPLEITYTSSTMFHISVESKGFMFRITNLFAVMLDLLISLWQHYFMKPIYEKHFPSDRYASYEKAKERVTMVLFSHHFSEKPVRPLVPGLIEIGGIHLNEEPKPLPKDIEDFVTSAKHGVIFFSLGTNVKTTHLQPQTLEKIYNVLSKLPQKVLWKCDDESKVPGNSSNILFRKWMPQADILGHPNVKLFFGHGGKGGITEAKFYGVPMVGLPIFGDQPMNMEEVVQKAYGLSLNHDRTLSEELILNAVKEVLENNTYTNNVKKFSNLYRDRPLKIKDNAVYWLEYLIRYKGAPHLQSPLKTMSFVEANNLDVFACLFVGLYLVFQIMKFSAKLVFRLVCGTSRQKTKKD